MRLLATIAMIVLLAGCASDDAIQHQPAPLVDADKLPVYGDVVWDVDVGEGSGTRVTGFQLAVDGRHVYVAGPEGVVTSLKLKNGETAWSRETGLQLISGPAYASGQLLLGTRDGQLVALSAKDGHKLWQQQLSSIVLAAPAIGRGTVVVHTLDGNLAAFNLKTGQRIWTLSRSVPTLTIRGLSRPVIRDGVVYAGLDNGKVLALDLSNGEMLWQKRIGVPSGRSDLERIVDIDASLLVLDSRIYAGSMGGKVSALSRSNGRIVWKQDIVTHSGFTFDRNQIFTTGISGGVWSLGRLAGAVRWHQEVLAYRRLTKPVMYRGYVMVGDYQGYLHLLSSESGELIGRIEAMDEPILASPVVVGERIIVLGADGTVAAVKAIRPESE